MIGFDDKRWNVPIWRGDRADPVRLSPADIVLMAANKTRLTAPPSPKPPTAMRLMFRHLRCRAFCNAQSAHEIAARDILRDTTGLPVTCSHELSSALGGPRRAVTAVLNARLINLLDQLIAATKFIMKQQGLDCPLMVVKGDGSLLESGYARTRPVETVLSGPAASLSGAAFLADTESALVADIGGTTTDIAFLHNGAPRLKSEGAFVGGWQTMVEAAEIRTCGLGGDSEVTHVARGRISGLNLGPRRACRCRLWR